MTTPGNAPDLSVTPPRGLDEELEGYAWLPRMLDKARATLAHTNGSYQFGCPVDHTCMARLGVSPELVLELAGRWVDDHAVLEALRRHGIPSAQEAWFDGQAVEDELQGPGWYLKVRPGSETAGTASEIMPGHCEPPTVSTEGRTMTVSRGELTFCLGRHQSRTVQAGEMVTVPAGVEWWFENRGATAAWLSRR
jgi:quercetin dioxygenase-like cupin family protein